MKNNSAIRMMFEEGNKLAAKYGRENVFDFSLGNPSVPAPAEVNQAIQDIVKEEDSLFVHGYMSNAGYEDVRETIAQSLNRRFGTSFHAGNILMTVGAASGLNVILKTLLNPGEQVITFAPYFVEYGSYVRYYDGELVVVSPNTVLGCVNAPSLMQRVIKRCVDANVNLEAYDRNRNLLYNGLKECGFSCIKPEGAFYLFVKSPVENEKEFCEVCKQYNVLVVPGSSFACPGYVRIAYCVSYGQIERSLPAFRKIAEHYNLV